MNNKSLVYLSSSWLLSSDDSDHPRPTEHETISAQNKPTRSIKLTQCLRPLQRASPQPARYLTLTTTMMAHRTRFRPDPGDRSTVLLLRFTVVGHVEIMAFHGSTGYPSLFGLVGSSFIGRFDGFGALSLHCRGLSRPLLLLCFRLFLHSEVLVQVLVGLVWFPRGAGSTASRLLRHPLADRNPRQNSSR